MADPNAPLLLVVDDEPAIVRAVGAALETRGYRVMTASTAGEALDAAVTHHLAAIILDLGLPDFDGI